jgi:hypothetical protein
MKVRLLLCLIKHHIMNEYGVEVQLHIFLNLKLCGSKWLVSRLGKYFPLPVQGEAVLVLLQQLSSCRLLREELQQESSYLSTGL